MSLCKQHWRGEPVLKPIDGQRDRSVGNLNLAGVVSMVTWTEKNWCATLHDVSRSRRALNLASDFNFLLAPSSLMWKVYKFATSSRSGSGVFVRTNHRRGPADINKNTEQSRNVGGQNSVCFTQVNKHLIQSQINAELQFFFASSECFKTVGLLGGTLADDRWRWFNKQGRLSINRSPHK